MPWPDDHKARTREKIVRAAAAAFRAGGVAGVRLEDVMARAGLTHGGFYAHFKSKGELVEKALQVAAAEMDTHCEMLFSQDKPVRAFIDSYLSKWHVTSPHQGCPLPTMCSELGQRGLPSATTDTVIEARLKQVEKALGESPDAQDQSIVTLATLVGALVLSRSAENQALAQKILDVTRAHLKDQVED